MGVENSTIVDEDTPPSILSERSLDAVADYIKHGKDGVKPRRIVVMTGAGLSTAAGIPDFRSPGTGLYSNLQRLNLPHPEAVFEIDYFRGHPEPFYVLAKELYPGKFFPTVSHAFIALLNEKGLLSMLFTQNIDCLERQAGVPDEKIVEAHGSFATQRCIDCKTEYPGDLMKEAVESGEVPHCITPQCNGLVKPDIVFFGEGLPERFFQNLDKPMTADLIIVLGTSLQVMPFASLPSRAAPEIPRILFNMQRVGDLGTRADDVLELGDCDAGIRKLADALGWRQELEALHLEVGGKVSAKEAARLRAARREEKSVEERVARLSDGISKTLLISDDPHDADHEPPTETENSEVEETPVPAPFPEESKVLTAMKPTTPVAAPSAPAEAKDVDVEGEENSHPGASKANQESNKTHL